MRLKFISFRANFKEKGISDNVVIERVLIECFSVLESRGAICVEGNMIRQVCLEVVVQ